MGLSLETVRQIEEAVLIKLRSLKVITRASCDFNIDPFNVTYEERKQIEIIIRDIQLQNGDLAENIEALRTIQERINTRKKIGIKQNLATGLSLEIDENKTRKKESEKLEIENLGFSVRTFNVLKRNGIESLADLSNLTEEQLKEFRWFGKKCIDEIIAKMSEYGISFKEEDNDEAIKQTLIKRILEQQKTIKQQEEIIKLSRKKMEIQDE